MSWLSDKSPVVADIPKKYPVGNFIPWTEKHSFHAALLAISVDTTK